MKKFLLYFIAFFSVIFVLPVLFTNQNKNIEKDNYKNENDIQKEINNEVENSNTKYSNIRLLHKDTNEVEQLNIEDYLYNVVSAEMPADFEKEALKAQAVVARTYTIYKVNNKKHEEADICDDSSCCQAWISKENRYNKWEESKREEYWNKIVDCVNETKGKIITYENEPINAFFHANSGGKTELPINVWGGNTMPYLQIVETSGENEYSGYSSEVKLTYDELINKLKEKYQDIKIDFNNDEDIKILERTNSDRVKTIKLGNHELSGVELRTILGLKSTNFEFSKDKNMIIFKVIGYGHGVGMSQTGADSLAKKGENYEQIINHFYSGITIKDINNI